MLITVGYMSQKKPTKVCESSMQDIEKFLCQIEKYTAKFIKNIEQLFTSTNDSSQPSNEFHVSIIRFKNKEKISNISVEA